MKLGTSTKEEQNHMNNFDFSLTLDVVTWCLQMCLNFEMYIPHFPFSIWSPLVIEIIIPRKISQHISESNQKQGQKFKFHVLSLFTP